jgi:hypothetical protein
MDIGNDNDKFVERAIVFAQKVQEAAPFVSDMLISFVDGMKGRFALGTLVVKIEEAFGPELAPVRDLLRRIDANSALTRAALVRKIIDEYQLTEETAYKIATNDVTSSYISRTIKDSIEKATRHSPGSI